MRAHPDVLVVGEELGQGGGLLLVHARGGKLGLLDGNDVGVLGGDGVQDLTSQLGAGTGAGEGGVEGVDVPRDELHGSFPFVGAKANSSTLCRVRARRCVAEVVSRGVAPQVALCHAGGRDYLQVGLRDRLAKLHSQLKTDAARPYKLFWKAIAEQANKRSQLLVLPGVRVITDACRCRPLVCSVD